jgi:hypothetical protein
VCVSSSSFVSVIVPLLSFVSLSPPSWWTISVVFFVFFFYFLLERGPIGRGLLSRRLVRRRRWRLKGHLCSFSLFFTFSFSYRSLPCFAVQTGLVDTGSADRCGGARCYLG